jgi:hypothetical protein
VLLSGCAVAPPTSEGAPAAIARLPVPVQAAALLHAGPREVQGTLGAPDLKRVDGTAEVWLYAAAPDCRVDVVFYPEAGGTRVALAAARVAAPMREEACLKMVAARAGI